MRAIAGLVLVVTGAAGLGCAQTPYQMRKEHQAKQAERLRPAELEHKRAGWRAVRTLRVRLYADAAAKRDDLRESFEERLARANQVLESALRLRLKLEEVRDLPPQPEAADSDALLAALEQLDPGHDVDLVIALIGAAPVVTLSFHDLGRARVLGKHIVLRTMDDLGELRALEGFDTLDPGERSRLYQQRKRHKETAVLLHELGHTLGALHTRDPLELMHPAYDNEMQGFAPANSEVMGYSIDERTADEGARDEARLLRRMADYIAQSDYSGWLEGERSSHLEVLQRALEPRPQPQPSASAGWNPVAPGPAAPSVPTTVSSGTPSAVPPGVPVAVRGASGAPDTPAPAPPAHKAEDLSALSAADRERYLSIDQALQAERVKDAKATVSDLARRYPDNYAVQQKACQVGMKLGLGHRELKGYCDRMLKLSMQPGP